MVSPVLKFLIVTFSFRPIFLCSLTTVSTTFEVLDADAPTRLFLLANSSLFKTSSLEVLNCSLLLVRLSSLISLGSLLGNSPLKRNVRIEASSNAVFAGPFTVSGTLTIESGATVVIVWVR